MSPLAKPETIMLAFATFETIIFSATVLGRTDRAYSVLRSGSFRRGVTSTRARSAGGSYLIAVGLSATLTTTNPPRTEAETLS